MGAVLAGEHRNFYSVFFTVNKLVKGMETTARGWYGIAETKLVGKLIDVHGRMSVET